MDCYKNQIICFLHNKFMKSSLLLNYMQSNSIPFRYLPKLIKRKSENFTIIHNHALKMADKYLNGFNVNVKLGAAREFTCGPWFCIE